MQRFEAEDSETMTNDLLAISIADDLPLPSSVMLRDSFNRSTSIYPKASEIHLAAQDATGTTSIDLQHFIANTNLRTISSAASYNNQRIRIRVPVW